MTVADSRALSVSVDGNGFPVIFDPGKTIKVDLPTTNAAPAPTSLPAGVDQDEWARRMDAVRDAAREFEELSEQDVKERLRGLTNKDLDAPAIAQFRADVQEAQIADLVDMLDQRQRGILRNRRTVRVQAPRNYFRKALHGLDDEKAKHVAMRLRARGWGDKDVQAGFVGKFSEQRASTLPKDL